ncbi:MAG: response regulator [Pyrinomonadaceae bacterium]
MKTKVLIVDDDWAITQQLFWTLCDDYDVTTANDLQSALRRATVYEPEIAILDLHLPPVPDSPEVGLRVLEFIKMRFPKAKVLIVSSAASRATQQACLDGGADEFLDKPFEIEHLLGVMRRHAPAQVPEAA